MIGDSYKTRKIAKIDEQKLSTLVEECKARTLSKYPSFDLSVYISKAKDLTKRLQRKVDCNKYSKYKQLLVEGRLDKKGEKYLQKSQKIIDEHNKIWKDFCYINMQNHVGDMLLKSVDEKKFNIVDIVGLVVEGSKLIKAFTPQVSVGDKKFPKNKFTIRDYAIMLTTAVKQNGSWQLVYCKRFENKQKGYLKSDIKKLLKKTTYTVKELRELGRFESALKLITEQQIENAHGGLIKFISNKKLLNRITKTINEQIARGYRDCVISQAVSEFGVNSVYYKKIDVMQDMAFRRSMKVKNSTKKKKIKKMSCSKFACYPHKKVVLTKQLKLIKCQKVQRVVTERFITRDNFTLVKPYKKAVKIRGTLSLTIKLI